MAHKEGPQHALLEIIEQTKRAAAEKVAFSEAELDRAVLSLQNLTAALDWPALRSVFSKSAHEPHKEWAKTEEASGALRRMFSGADDPALREVFARVLRDGNWDRAATAAAARPASEKPWVVLVTGLNGIRKTTCVYQRWFKDILHEALLDRHPDAPAKEELPDGSNSFFRQLDYIIAAVANEEFRTLYELDDMSLYASLKESIFARYRMLAEMWGAVLVKEAQAKRMNVMIETSGRDPAMFEYVDHFFPDGEYRKLAMNFDINDVGFAEASVDARMGGEMKAGREALVRGGDAVEMVNANAGGPYGSKVLRKVQAESQHVWRAVLRGAGPAEAWYKATISIRAHRKLDWSARVSREGDDEGPFEEEEEDDEGEGSAEAFVFAPL